MGQPGGVVWRGGEGNCGCGCGHAHDALVLKQKLVCLQNVNPWQPKSRRQHGKC